MNEPVVPKMEGAEGGTAVPRTIAAAAGKEANDVMNKIWGDGGIDVGEDGSDQTPDPAATPATPAAAGTPAPAAAAVVPSPNVAPNAAISTITGLPADLVPDGAKATPAAAATPVDDAAEEAKAQQLSAALPEKAQREAFASLRVELKAERQKRKEAEAKAAEMAKTVTNTQAQTGQATAEALAAVTKELEDTKARLEAQESELGKSNYERSREYQEKYLIPQQQVITKMAKLVETVGGREKKDAKAFAESILRASPAERAQILANESVALQASLLSSSADFDDLSENGKIALDNWKSRQAAVTEEQRRMDRMGLVKNLFENTEKAVGNLVQEGNVLFARSNDNPEWNKGVDERVAAVRGVLQTGDPAVLIKHIADGVSAPKWREMYWATVKAYAELKDQAGKVLGATPGVGGDTSVAATAAPKPTNPKAIMDSIWGPDSL